VSQQQPTQPAQPAACHARGCCMQHAMLLSYRGKKLSVARLTPNESRQKSCRQEEELSALQDSCLCDDDEFAGQPVILASSVSVLTTAPSQAGVQQAGFSRPSTSTWQTLLFNTVITVLQYVGCMCSVRQWRTVSESMTAFR
jgi:hypothetical protein